MTTTSVAVVGLGYVGLPLAVEFGKAVPTFGYDLSAEKIEHYLKDLNLSKADVVISSLPLANFPKDLRESILSASHRSLKDVGQYVQFQYSLQSRKALKRIFHSVRLDFTAFNFPPAFIYTCSN